MENLNVSGDPDLRRWPRSSTTDLEFFKRGNNRFLTKWRFQNVLPGGTTESTTAAAEPVSNLCYLCNNLDVAAINFCHNNSAPPGICIKNSGAFTSWLFPGEGRRFDGVVPKRRAFSINDFCHFWNFHHYGRNWRLDNTLEFICCSETVYVFKDNDSILDSTKTKKLK